ncbi:MAG: PCRF domain-containing protein, partial [Propionibacteriaceae bacterium]
MFESVQSLLAQHEELQVHLSDPDLHSDPARSKKVNRRYAELARIVAAYEEWRKLSDDVEAATEMAAEDEAFAAELPGLTEQLDLA